MTSNAEIAEAREQVRRTRERLESTYEAIGDRVTAPVRHTVSALDVAQLVRDHPWPALAVAVGAGVALATTGLDRRAATATAQTARQVGTSTVRAARATPSRTRGAVVAATDSLATRVVTSFVSALRERPAGADTTPPPDALGFVRSTTPAHESDAATA
jgi:ElaB/YqjD/DUF883 family membrane-anchored ribosome-binding protein